MSKYCLYSFVLVFLGVNCSISAQNPFEGKVTYAITYEHDASNGEQILNKLPYKCIYITNGSSWRSQWKSEIGEDYTIIYNAARDSIFHLVKIGDNRLTIPYGTSNEHMFDGASKTIQLTIGAMQVTLKEIERSSEPYDETYFLTPTTYKILPRSQYESLLK